MELNSKLVTSSFLMPATTVFTHSSRIADTWTPMPERVWLPARQVSEGEVSISVKAGNTRDLKIPFRSRHPKRIMNHLRTIELGDQLIFDARFETDGNVAHQLLNVLPRVLLSRREISAGLGREVEITVILRDGAKGYSQAVHRQVGLPVMTTDSQLEGVLVRVDDVEVSSFENGRMILAGGAPAIVAIIHEVVTSAPFLSSDPGDLPEKIFLSRRGSRTITNEAEITELLEGRGFRTFYFEDEPYERQMLLCRHARVVVAIHGAAMAYLVFNGNGLSRPKGDLSGLRIVELFGSGYAVDCYRRLAAVLNAHWCGVRGKITTEVIRDLDERNLPRSHEKDSFRVDPETLEMALEYSERVSSGSIQESSSMP